jgi:mannose-6-phosphate isomerase-like protein (cupin superfamily)
MADYTIKKLEDVPDVMGDYPGEMRMFGDHLGTEQVAFSFRRMPPDTGGRGNYGHNHQRQDEVYYVISGTLTFKIEDEEFPVEAGTAVNVPAHVVRSVHNDTDQDVELVIVSLKAEDEAQFTENFWPN